MSSHPADVASCPSRFWLLWLWPLLRKGAHRPLKEEDIYEIPQSLRAEFLDSCWHKTVSGGTGTLLSVLFRTYGRRYIWITIIVTVWLWALAIVPYLTDRLFQWLVATEVSVGWEDKAEGLMWSVLLVGSYLTSCNSGCQWYQQTTRLGCELRSSAAMMVFRRTLQLRIQDENRDAALNLMQVDAERLYIFAQLNHLLIVAVLISAVSMFYLTVYEGIAVAAVAVGVVLGTVALQILLSRCAWPARRRMQQFSDARISLMAEILDAAKVLKMYGWTEPLQRRVEEIRQKELHQAWIYLGIRGFSSALLYICPSLAMFSVLLMMYLQGKELSADRVFFIFTAVGLNRAPLGGAAIGLSAVVDGLTAFRRLNAFVASGHFDMYLEDLQEEHVKKEVAEKVEISGSFSHGGSSSSRSKLTVDLSLGRGELVAVCGRVAAGKSSLLLAMLGEMTSDDASVDLPPGVAYLAQTPWIRSGTVKDSVVQELPFQEKLYWRALRAAQLLPDLKVWKGDAHPVGARGTTLSGGQRARLGLAQILYRCLVSDVQLVLLDDCLAAVDVHVARAICEEALLGILLDGKRTVVMVMNSNFVALRQADRIVNLVDGVASVFPTIADWSAACGESAWKTCQQTIGNIEKREASCDPVSFSDEVAVLENAEVSQSGRLHIRTFSYYFGSGRHSVGCFCLAWVLLSMFLVEALRVYSDRFMGIWAARDADNTEDESSNDFRTFCIWLSFAVIGAFARAWLVVRIAITSSRSIHHRLLEGVMSASLDFFDTIPRGRILGYFSKDIDAMDALLPQYLLDFLQDFTMMLGIVVVCIWSAPLAAVAVVPVLFAFFRIRKFFSCTARETKRLDGLTRAPLYSALGDAADGLATLRAHGQQRGLVQHFRRILDRNGKVFFQTNVLQPWCILTLDSLGSLIVFIASGFMVFARENVDVSLATMAISYSLMTRGKLQFCIRLSIEAENQFVAAERLQHFEKLALSYREGGHSTTEQRASPWCIGDISFQDVVMRYRPEHPVLNGLSLEIKAKQKVGLVGRTGSGKSSLLSLLLRITEAASGAILVGGRNIQDIDLHSLRASISLVPQEPILWSGSVAQNLDPTGNLPKQTLLEALTKVHLDQKLHSQGGLATVVEMRGNNFSLGQRQLLCIARCIARSSSIVLVDEATSCVDGETDALIQEAFHNEFKDCTMLVVAHRLQTVMDSDLIAVLDAGRVVETGTPTALSADKSSHFARLIRGCAAGIDDVFTVEQSLDNITTLQSL